MHYKEKNYVAMQHVKKYNVEKLAENLFRTPRATKALKVTVLLRLARMGVLGFENAKPGFQVEVYDLTKRRLN